MRYSIQINDQPHELSVEQDEQGHYVILLDGQPLPLEAAQVGPDRWSLMLAGRSYEGFVRSVPGDGPTDSRHFEVMLEGLPYEVDLVDARRRSLQGLAASDHESGEVTLKAPMPGLVVDVLVAVGAAVERGQRIVVLEAMKMQNDLTAPRPGIIHAVKVEKGQAVNQGQPLLAIGD